MSMKSSKRLQPPPPFHIENIRINNLKKNSKWEIPFQKFASSTYKLFFLLRCDSYYDGSNNMWLQWIIIKVTMTVADRTHFCIADEMKVRKNSLFTAEQISPVDTKNSFTD